MSLRSVLGVVGAVVGAIWGGPAGARWGFAIGSTIGSIVDPGTVKGPSIGDIAQQTSQAGGPRPIVFVRSPPIGGNVIAQGEPVITKEKQSGKSGPSIETEVVHRTYAVGVCEGPVGGFRRIWRNNTLVYDATADADLSDEEVAAFLQTARFFLGTYDQLPSPDLEALFGVGTTPAHRGTCYMVMADEDLTDLRGAIPQWTFEISSASTSALSTDVLYPWGGGTGQSDPRNGDNWHQYTYYFPTIRPLEKAPKVGPWYGGDTFDAGLGSAVAQGNLTTWQGSSSTHYLTGNYSAGPFGWSQNRHSMSPVLTATPGESVDLYFHYNRQMPTYFQGVGTIGPLPHYGYCEFEFHWTPPLLVPEINRFDWWSPNDSYGSGLANTGVWSQIGNLTQPPAAGNNCTANTTAGGTYLQSDALIKMERVPRSPVDGVWTPVSGDFRVLALYTEAGADVTKVVTQYPLNPCLVAGDPLDNSSYWISAYNAAVLAGDMPAGLTYGVHYPKAKATAWLGTTSSVDSTRPLTDIITEICERANVPASLLDLSGLEASSEGEEQQVYGLITINQYPAAEALRALGQIYLFDLSPRDGLLAFVPRGGDHVTTITEDDMVDDDRQIAEDKRDDSISVPRVLHLMYNDVAGGLNSEQQTSERSGDRRSIGEQSIQSPVILTADMAARAVVINHKVLAENAKGTLSFAVSDKFLELTTADPIFITREGLTKRIRLEQVDVFDGYLDIKASYDRQSAYTSNVEGIPARAQTPPPSSMVGPTLIVPLDIPLFSDTDDPFGMSYYVAVAGTTQAWRGALVELSYDGGANYVDSRIAQDSATIGTLTEIFGDHPQEFPDVINSLALTILMPELDLESTDLEGMMNRANLAAVGNVSDGWELINYANVDEESSEGNWVLDYFLRGRKDTVTTVHPAGDTFVKLDRGLVGFVPAQLTDLNRTLTFRATSIGAPTTTGTIVSMTLTGQTQTERHPAYVMVIPSAGSSDDSVTVRWQGVGRLGGGAQAAHGIRFETYRVTFDDHVNAPIVIDTLLTEITQDISSLAVGVTSPTEQLFGTDTPLQRVTVQGGTFIGAYSNEVIRYDMDDGTIQGSMPIVSAVGESKVTGFLIQGGFIYTSAYNDSTLQSFLYRIDPAAVTIGAVLAFTHSVTSTDKDFQGVATDGTYLYASQTYTGQIRKVALADLSLVDTLPMPGLSPGQLTVEGTQLFVCCQAVDKISVIDLGTFAETVRFNCVQFPLDVAVTDDLVFVQGIDQLGVYTKAGVNLQIFDSPSVHDGAPILQDLAYDGSRVFKGGANGMEFYRGNDGTLSSQFLVPRPVNEGGAIGGYAGGAYFIESHGPLLTIGLVFDSETTGATVSVAQVNELTGAGPAIEVTIT